MRTYYYRTSPEEKSLRYGLSYQPLIRYFRLFSIFYGLYLAARSCFVEGDSWHALEFIGMPMEGEEGWNDNWGEGIRVGVIDQCSSDDNPDVFIHSRKPPVKSMNIGCRKNCPTNKSMGLHGSMCCFQISGETQEVDFFGICQGKLRGGAPSCDLFTYALGCSCGGKNPKKVAIKGDYICKAIAQGISDKLRVISMSLGPSIAFDSTSDFLDKLDDLTLTAFSKGIVVIMSAGNKGPYLATVNYGMPWCGHAGASNSMKVITTKVEVAVLKKNASSSGTNVDDFELIGTLEGLSLNLIEDDNFYMLFVDPNSEGKDSVIHRKYNPRTKLYSMFLESGTVYEEAKEHLNLATDHPLATLGRNDTIRLRDWHRKRRPIYIKISQSRFRDDPRGIYVPKFSSRGPSKRYKGTIGPSVVAPGYSIMLPWPSHEPLTTAGTRTFSVKQAIKSGTSFAAPLLAAIVICLLQLNPSWGPSVILSALMTTATRFARKRSARDVFACGAGLVNLSKAAKPGLVYEETTRNFREYRSGSLTTLKLNVPYFCFPVWASPIPFELIFLRKLKNLEDGPVEYRAMISQDGHSDQGVEIRSEPDTLQFDGKGDEKEFRLIVSSTGMVPLDTISAELVWKCTTSDCEVASPIIVYDEDLIED